MTHGITLVSSHTLSPIALSFVLAIAGCSKKTEVPAAEVSAGGATAGNAEEAHDHAHDHESGELHAHPHDATHHAGESREHAESAMAVMAPTAGSSVAGTVSFRPLGHVGVEVSIDLIGLSPGETRAIHVHEVGDCSAPDGASAGGHYNPDGHEHGLPDTTPRHAGDMGNVTADEAGAVHAVRTFDNFSIDHHRAPVLGRSVIVHASEDDGHQPTGNAGARVACGVIVAVAP